MNNIFVLMLLVSGHWVYVSDAAGNDTQYKTKSDCEAAYESILPLNEKQIKGHKCVQQKAKPVK